MVKLTTKIVLQKASSKTIPRPDKIIPLAKQMKDNEDYLKGLTHMHFQENYISSIGDISGCSKLKVLYLHHNSITEIKNLHSCNNLTELYLQHNKIARMENLNLLKNLRKLYLGHNFIAVVEGLEGLEQLEDLHIERQQLPPGETLLFDPRTVRSLATCLLSLDVSGNQLGSLYEIAALHELRSLVARDNLLADLEDLAGSISCCVYLANLELRGNLVCSMHKYREVITAAASWSLGSLDGKTISDNSRSFMKKFGPKREKIASSQHNLRRSLIETMPFEAPPVRGKSSTLPPNQLSVSGGARSKSAEAQDTYIAWQRHRAESSKSVLPMPYQRQSLSVLKKRVQASDSQQPPATEFRVTVLK